MLCASVPCPSLLRSAGSSVVVSGAIELLVHACSSQDRAIRLAGQENLHKLVKVTHRVCLLYTSSYSLLSVQGLQSSHLSRLQQDLFHELKKVSVHLLAVLVCACMVPPEWQCTFAECGAGGVCCSLPKHAALSAPVPFPISVAGAAAAAGS